MGEEGGAWDVAGFGAGGPLIVCFFMDRSKTSSESDETVRSMTTDRLEVRAAIDLSSVETLNAKVHN